MWRALSEQLEELRRTHVAGAKDSVEFLKRLLEVARQVVEAERAEAEADSTSSWSSIPTRGR